MNGEVRSPIAIHVTRYSAFRKTQFPGFGVEGGLADEGEGLIACLRGVGIDAAQVDEVRATVEILDGVGGGNARVRGIGEDERIRSAPANQQILSAFSIEFSLDLVAARPTIQHIVAASSVKGIVARAALDHIGGSISTKRIAIRAADDRLDA